MRLLQAVLFYKVYMSSWYSNRLKDYFPHLCEIPLALLIGNCNDAFLKISLRATQAWVFFWDYKMSDQ